MKLTPNNKVNFARELLSKDNILIGYELEDGELSGHNRKVLIRPITQEYFKNIWEHGRKYCSKMAIYLISEKVFIERRPDIRDYSTEGDPMYNGNLIEGAVEMNNEHMEAIGEESFNNSTIHTKERLSNRIEWIIEHLIDVKDLGEDCYNMVFKE